MGGGRITLPEGKETQRLQFVANIRKFRNPENRTIKSNLLPFEVLVFDLLLDLLQVIPRERPQQFPSNIQ